MTMRVSFLWIAVLLFLFSVGPAAADGQTSPSAQQLLSLAPNLSLQEKDISSFQTNGRLDLEQVHLKFELLAEKPDRTALRVLDAKDNTPILWASGRTFMFYDPLANEVVMGEGVPIFEFRMEKAGNEAKEDEAGKEQLAFGFGISTNLAKAASGMAADLKSFWNDLQDPPEVRPAEKGTWLLCGRTRRGGRIVAQISPHRAAGPYTRLDLYFPEAEKVQGPFCTLDEIMVNQPARLGRFDIPKGSLLNSGLRVRQIESQDTPDVLFDMGKCIRAMLARLAINGADEIKPLVEKICSEKPDWEALAIGDQRASKILRSMAEERQ